MADAAKTKAFVNFYENLQEAVIRLKGTVVMYEGLPHYVWTITDHKGDGKFRIYIQPIGVGERPLTLPGIEMNSATMGANAGETLDQYIAGNKGTILLRKRMDSKHFNNYRPFPLGMYNAVGSKASGLGPATVYLQRQPQRPNREQGLTKAFIDETKISVEPQASSQRFGTRVEIYSEAMRACILAEHPSAKECLAVLKDKDMANDAAAFHRDFALVRGPIDMVFLVYKTDVIGVLPNTDFSVLRLGREFKHCKEVVEELRLFATVSS